MKRPHPAVERILSDPTSAWQTDQLSIRDGGESATSLSLARALAVGCLSRLRQDISSVRIWDPAAGIGLAGHMMVDALQTAGTEVEYRGQDINDAAVVACRQRFETVPNAQIALGDSLLRDPFEDFQADLVLIDGPWGMEWKQQSAEISKRREQGAFSFGLPHHADSTWLFISLAIEKLRPPAEGGGRVAALVHPGALSHRGSASVRGNIMEAGLLESVTRLPESLAPTTSIPLFLLTFTNRIDRSSADRVMVADLQTEYSTEHRRRSIPASALSELENGLRTRRPGPRNRFVSDGQLRRSEARLSRRTGSGHQLSWRLSVAGAIELNDEFLNSRYGASAGVLVEERASSSVDLNPSRFFADESRDRQRDLESRGWPARRLSSLLAEEPGSGKLDDLVDSTADLFVPTTQAGLVAADAAGTGSSGRILALRLEPSDIEPSFLIAWLNSEQGIESRRRAIEASSSGAHINALRSDPAALMRWADELILPAPDQNVQIALAGVDRKLASFKADLEAERAAIWTDPDSADDVLEKFAPVFEDSLSRWLDSLPFPIATALWTAKTANSLAEKQDAYIRAWEAIVAFHATVLLAVSRSDPGGSDELESSISKSLRDARLGIERASFGTWIVIVEKISAELRRALASKGDGSADDVARIRRAFGDLRVTSIERLISKDLMKKFNEVNGKRNAWLGHVGYTPEADVRAHVDSLLSDLADLRLLIGNVWTQFPLVRAGSARRSRAGWVQTAELATGTRSPFETQEFTVGDPMHDRELYLVRDGAQTPLRLGGFVQLRGAPPGAQYTSYFYNRTEGSTVRLISYQHGSENVITDELELFREDFGGLRRT